MPSTYLGTEFFLLTESAPNLLSESEGRKEGRKGRALEEVQRKEREAREASESRTTRILPCLLRYLKDSL